MTCRLKNTILAFEERTRKLHAFTLQLGFAVWTVLKNALTVVQIFIVMWEMHQTPQRKTVTWAGKNIFIYVFIYWFIFFQPQSHWCYRAEEKIFISVAVLTSVFTSLYIRASVQYECVFASLNMCTCAYLCKCMYLHNTYVVWEYLCVFLKSRWSWSHGGVCGETERGIAGRPGQLYLE